jgi:hypothetical protein
LGVVVITNGLHRFCHGIMSHLHSGIVHSEDPVKNEFESDILFKVKTEFNEDMKIIVVYRKVQVGAKNTVQIYLSG